MRDIRIEGDAAWVDGRPLPVPPGADPYAWAVREVARDAEDPVDAMVHREGRSVPVRIAADGHVVVLDGVRAALPPPAGGRVAEERPRDRRLVAMMLVSSLGGAALTLGALGVAGAVPGATLASEGDPGTVSRTSSVHGPVATTAGVPGSAGAVAARPASCGAPADGTAAAPVATSTTVVTRSVELPAPAGGSPGPVVRTVAGAPGPTTTLVRNEVVTVPTTVVATTTAIRGVTYTAFRTRYATVTVTATRTVKYYCSLPPSPPGR